jgi:hypothetical protein
VYTTSSAPKSTPLSEQAFGKPDVVQKAHEEFVARLKDVVRGWKGRLAVFLEEEETVGVLMPPLQVSDWVSGLLLALLLAVARETKS